MRNLSQIEMSASTEADFAPEIFHSQKHLYNVLAAYARSSGLKVFKH
jgi:hypothetical protein